MEWTVHIIFMWMCYLVSTHYYFHGLIHPLLHDSPAVTQLIGLNISILICHSCSCIFFECSIVVYATCSAHVMFCHCLSTNSTNLYTWRKLNPCRKRQHTTGRVDTPLGGAPSRYTWRWSLGTQSRGQHAATVVRNRYTLQGTHQLVLV